MSGPLAGQTFEVQNELVIGREETDVTIQDDELSSRHAVVRRFANRLQVEDLGSANGTFVDGSRIEEPTLLGGGAEIKLGTTVLVVEGVLPVQAEGGLDDPSRNLTRVSSVDRAMSANAVGGAAGATASVPPAPAAQPAAAPSAPAQPVGEFRPPQRRRQRGLASRSWVPVALSFGTVVLVAVALVIYFSQHT